ncbi:type II toxin-antitoxin system VapC family toxin [Candidatus Microgenomates bacterium]|nr:type II toxin-antitoxin system VapC family toxin [Candidatus Microgenomates bacterium]
MRKIVLDTSVIIKWFTKEIKSSDAKVYLEGFREGKYQIVLPELAKYELGNAILKGKKFSFYKARKIFSTFYSFPLIFVEENESQSLLTYKTAQKLNITYYDASFLALAKQEKATLITANPKHQKKIAGIKIQTLI